MLTIMGITARDFKIDLSGATVRVQKEMVTSPIRRIGKLAVEVSVPHPLPQDQQRRLREAAARCPVCKSIHADIETPVTFKFG